MNKIRLRYRATFLSAVTPESKFATGRARRGEHSPRVEKLSTWHMWRARTYFGLAFLCCCTLIAMQLQRPIADTQPLGEAPEALHPRQKRRPAGSPPLSRPPLEVRPRRAEPPPPLLQEALTLAVRGGPVTEVGEELEEQVEEEEEEEVEEVEEGEPEPRPPEMRLPEAEEPAAPTDVRTSVADRSWCAKAAREHGVVPHQAAAHIGLQAGKIGLQPWTNGVAALYAWGYGAYTRGYSGLQPWIPPVTEHLACLAADVGLLTCGQPGHLDQARLRQGRADAGTHPPTTRGVGQEARGRRRRWRRWRRRRRRGRGRRRGAEMQRDARGSSRAARHKLGHAERAAEAAVGQARLQHHRPRADAPEGAKQEGA